MGDHRHGAHSHHGPAHLGGDGVAGSQRRLSVALVLAATYMVAEVIGGLITGSLALLADAGHMLSDVVALALSLVAIRIAQRPANSSNTYGYRRSEILAALVQGVLLVGVSVFIFIEAIERFREPREVMGGAMLGIAAGGLLVNLVGLAVLNSGRRDNLNIRGAWLHVLSDALGSVGAIVAGSVIWFGGPTWADSLASVLIATLVIHASWSLLREAVDVLMEAAPAHIDVDRVRASIDELGGVLAVHDLHVWTITSGMISLSGHVVAKDGSDTAQLLQQICDRLQEQFGIEHSTIQIEAADFREPGEICE